VPQQEVSKASSGRRMNTTIWEELFIPDLLLNG